MDPYPARLIPEDSLKGWILWILFCIGQLGALLEFRFALNWLTSLIYNYSVCAFLDY